ncbi:MAG: PRC-barrel domain-containing protein [Aliihoeflea sp.]
MLRKLLATTAVTALLAGGAFAQSGDTTAQQPQEQAQQGRTAAQEVTVSHGDTVIIEAAREEVELNLRVRVGAAGAQQTQAPEEQQAAQAGEQQHDRQATMRDRRELQAADMRQISADEFIGSEVFSVNDEHIGNVNDVLLTQDAEIDAVVVDVGGFLGMGAREVALGMDDLELLSDADGNWYVYTPYTQEQLESSPEYDQARWTEERDQQRVTGEMAQQMPAQQQADQQQDGQMAAEQRMGEAGEHLIADGGTIFVQSETENFQLNFEVRMAGQEAAQVGEADRQQTAQTDAGIEPDTQTTAAIDPDRQPVEMEQLRADDLIGSTLYGANDENIGTVGDILITEEGSFDAVIVDVGGFLGIGTREVALGLDEVEFVRDSQNRLYIYTRHTQDQLEAAPEYDEATYAEQRDQQRIGIQ